MEFLRSGGTLGFVAGFDAGLVIGGGAGLAAGPGAVVASPVGALVAGIAGGVGLGAVGWHSGAQFGSTVEDLILQARKEDIKQIDRLEKKYGLSKHQRDMLHREITGQDLPDDEIERIAQDIAKKTGTWSGRRGGARGRAGGGIPGDGCE